MTPYYDDGQNLLRCGRLEDLLPLHPECTLDACVCDPPYGLKFMGKRWDYDVPTVEQWRAIFRVLKPGAHLLAFGGTRTYHRMVCAIEDAGFEIRDQIGWVYGSGFPKSLDISKAIDKAAGAENVIGHKPDRWTGKGNALNFSTDRPQAECKVTAPATDDAKQWDGWGTALKPAWEPIVVARKPLDGTVAENVLRHGVGGVNVDGCRISFLSESDEQEAKGKNQHANFESGPMTNHVFGEYRQDRSNYNPPGRWPANVIHDGSDEVVLMFSASPSTRSSAARFFYCAKASKQDRDEGLDAFEAKSAGECTNRVEGTAGLNSPRAGAGRTNGSRNHHPTVKPTALMRYLCRLVTPPNGIILDPFMGSGSTGKAAKLEGFRFLGIEKDKDYCRIAAARIAAVKHDPQKVLAL